MKNKEKTVYSFLESKGFKLINKDASVFFGDYYDIFTNEIFQLRFSSSKSFETIDIRSSLLNENWYDLALVKALLYDEKNFNKITTIKEYDSFLQTNILKITELFSERNYLTTKKKLEELGNERVRQMFQS